MKHIRIAIMIALLALCGCDASIPSATATDGVPGTYLLSEGSHEAGKITIKGVDYYLVINKNYNINPYRPGYSLYVTRGSWQVCQPQVIADPGYGLQIADDAALDPKAYLAEAVEYINRNLVRQLDPSPLPKTWEETLEIELQRLQLVERNGKLVLE